MSPENAPHLTALLDELCEFTDEDMLLPLPVLVNIHRPTLRAPLQQLTDIAHSVVADTVDQSRWAELVEVARGQVNDAYPQLSDGKLFMEDDQINRLGLPLAEMLRNRRGHHRLRQVALHIPYATTVLVDSAVDTWYGYDPLTLLHRLTWAREEQAAVAAVLERELALSPQVREMILALGSLRP